MKLFQIRAIFANTAELEPRYVIARHEEEAARLFYLLYCVHSEDITEVPCELSISPIASDAIDDEGGSDGR